MYRHGYFRQRIDASGWQHEYWVDTDPDRLPAALVTGDDGEPLTVTVPVGGREVVAQVWRVDVGRVPLLLLDTDRPGERPRRPLDHRRACTSATPACASRQYALLGHRRRPRAARAGDRPAASCTSTRATRRSRAWSSRAPEVGRRLVRRRVRGACAGAPCSPPTRRSRPATTPTRRTSCASARRHRAASSASTPAALVRRGRTHPDDDDEPFGVTAVRAARQPQRQRRERPPRRGRARDVAAACGPTARSRTCRSGTSPTACTSRPGSARRCASLLDRHLGDGWTDRAVDPATWAAHRRRSPTPTCGPSRCAAARAT